MIFVHDHRDVSKLRSLGPLYTHRFPLAKANGSAGRYVNSHSHGKMTVNKTLQVGRGLLRGLTYETRYRDLV